MTAQTALAQSDEQHHERPDTPIPRASQWDSAVCEQCGSTLSFADRFCTQCGRPRPSAVQEPTVVLFREAIRQPFEGDAGPFWRRAARCAAATLAGLLGFMFIVQRGIGSVPTLAGCILAASASAVYVLCTMRDVLCPGKKGGPQLHRLFVAATIGTTVLYVPAVLLGTLMWGLCRCHLGCIVATPLVTIPYAMLMTAVAASSAYCVATGKFCGGTNPGLVAQLWQQRWHRYAAVALFASAYLAAAVPACVFVALATRALAHKDASRGTAFFQPLREIAAKLVKNAVAPDILTMNQRIAMLARGLGRALFVKLPLAGLAYWYALNAVVAMLIAHAYRGDTIVFRQRPVEAPSNGEPSHDWVDQPVAS